jgi:hypothetical protein
MRPSFVPSIVAVLLVLTLAPARAADCPSTVSFTPAESGSTADTGWTGLAIGRPILGNTLHLGVSCPSATSPCGTCTITGALPDPRAIFQRCSNDTSIPCTVPSEVLDCGAPDTCRIFLSPPQVNAIGGITACTTNEIIGPVTGTVDESGALTTTIAYTGKIYVGANSLLACPKCEDDPEPNNGVRSGHCDGGAHNGQPCDGHGVPTPGWEDLGTSSFDCPPIAATLIGTLSPGPVTFSTGTQTRTLTAASPDCTGVLGLKCLCDTCNDAAAEPCFSNADCPPSGGNPGICGGTRCDGGVNSGAPCASTSECAGAPCRRPGEFSRPNACVGGVCTDVAPLGDGLGECEDGPVDTYCANHPNRSCNTDADCDDVENACRARNRSCYVPDAIGESVSAVGVATPPVVGISQPTTLGMITCQGATRVAAVDNSLGLPGLARNHHTGTLTFGLADVCPLTPDTCRTAPVPGYSELQLKDGDPDAKDQLKWRAAKAAATTLADLGDPTTTDDYALCAYDPNGLRMTMRIPAGGTCDGRPCWKATSAGFQYKRKGGFPHGITGLRLRAGAAGKSQFQASGKGDFLPLPGFASITAPIEVQLRNNASGLCWGATYSAPFRKATATQLTARD